MKRYVVLPKYVLLMVKSFSKGMKHEHMCFSIIPKDSTEEVEEVPIEVEEIETPTSIPYCLGARFLQGHG